MNWIKSNYIVLGIIIVLILGICGTSFVALQNRKTAEQQALIIKEQAKNPKVIYKSAKEKTVYQDRVIEKKIYVGTNGTVVTEEKETIKDRIVEKEVIKETKIPVYTDITKEYTYILLGIAALHITGENDLIGIKGSILTGNFLFQCSYYRDYDFGNPFDFGKVKEPWRQTLEVSISYTLLKF